MHDIRRYDSKWDLLQDLAKGRQVLHFGVTGETGRPVETLVAQAPTGFHMALTQAAERCVGIELNAEAVRAIAEAGIFDNAIVADATTVGRGEIELDRSTSSWQATSSSIFRTQELCSTTLHGSRIAGPNSHSRRRTALDSLHSAAI